MMKIFFLFLFILISLYGENKEYFSQIKHFNPLYMDENGLKDDNEVLYKEIVQTIKTYINKNKKIKVTITGHTDRPTDIDDKFFINSSGFVNSIENIFTYSLSTQKSEDLSKFYAMYIKNKMIDDAVDKSVLLVDYKGGDDSLYTNETKNGRELSNRVMISLYVYEDINKDSDLDGVSDKKDICKGTLKGLPVDDFGCPFDDDKDGVYNYLDRCMATKEGLEVDQYGCIIKTNS